MAIASPLITGPCGKNACNIFSVQCNIYFVLDTLKFVITIITVNMNSYLFYVNISVYTIYSFLSKMRNLLLTSFSIFVLFISFCQITQKLLYY